MISTNGDVDKLNVTTVVEAKAVLEELYNNSSLSKKELTELVSFCGLSVCDTVKCYNDFIRSERQVNTFEKTFRRIAA